MLVAVARSHSSRSSRRQAGEGLRLLSVLAWGRNVEGQCGVELQPLVPRPTTLLDLHGAPATQLVAGKLSSAAVLQNGEVWTWGCGKSGKLGHGSAASLRSPHRVEWFVGRAAIAAAALGDQHSLFLDGSGGVWSCGENKEGQCGLGTPVELLAAQYRAAYHQSLRPSPMAHLQEMTQRQRQRQQEEDIHVQYLQSIARQPSGHVAWGWGTLRGQYHHPRPPTLAPTATASAAGGSGSSSTWGADISSSGIWGVDLDSHLSETGLQPGQVHTPSRVGQPSHHWAPAATSSSSGSSSLEEDALTPSSSSSSSSSSADGSASASSVPAALQQPGLAGQCVVSLAASKYFSAAVTGDGQLWTWGADYNGALGTSLSWSTSAAPVTGSLAGMLLDLGGAVSVAAGSTFVACLTAAGKVLVWGKLPTGTSNSSSSNSGGSGMGLSHTGPQAVEAVAGLPPITSIAAGNQHLLMTDGERVWGVGRWVDGNGDQAGLASWAAPTELLHLPAEGVAKVVAGPHSSAAVSGDGSLHLWGRLLEQHHAERVLRNARSDMPLEHMDWGWAGYGGAAPRLVEGVVGVRDVALGGWHALVMVE